MFLQLVRLRVLTTPKALNNTKNTGSGYAKKAVFRIRMDKVFLPIRIRTLKTRIRIRLLPNQWDLNDVFD